MATIVPAPVLDRSLQQALMGFAQPFGQGLKERGMQQALQQFAQQRGINIPRGLPPELVQQMIAQSFDPFGQRAGQAGLVGAQTGLAQAQAGQIGVQPPFTLGPGQQRFTPEGAPIGEPMPFRPFAPLAPRAPLTPSAQQIQRRLDRIDALEAIEDKTPAQQKELASLKRLAGLAEKPITRAGILQVAKEGDKTGLPAGTVFQADPQGNIKIISKVGEALSAPDKIKLAVTQAKEFRADPRIKNFQIIERSERGMTAALKQATSPNVKSRIASDQALGVLFQKMLDPESVVRESEFARTPEGAAAVNRLLAIAPQLRLGGLRLLDTDRRALVEMAQTLLNGAKISANRAFDEFTTRADEIGLNKKIIFGGAKKFDIGLPETIAPTIGLTPTEAARLAELEARE